VGGETPPTSIKEKETLWSEVPYVYPHQVREGREACLEIRSSGFHTTSAGAKKQTHPPTRHNKQLTFHFRHHGLLFDWQWTATNQSGRQ